jgi:methanogenic corrinoid protein MtbC1
MRAAAELDRESLMGELRASWARLGPLRFLQECAGPLMVEIGRGWERGALGVRHEHFASACMADVLREVREPFDRRARGPRVAAAMLPGDSHEGGLLMACTLMAWRDYRVVYLGANLPIEEIVAAARSAGVEVTAVSVSLALPRAAAARAIARLRRELPSRMPLWVGGAGAPPAIKGVERFATLEALDARLTSAR